MEKAKDKAAETTEKHTGFNALVSGLGIAPVFAFYIVCNTLPTYNSSGKTPLCHRVLLQLQHIARKTGQKAVRLPPCLQVLLSDAQSLDQGTISLDVILLQIVQQTTSLTYHLQQTTSGMMILRVAL